MPSEADIAVLKVQVEHLAKELEEQKKIVSGLKQSETSKLRAAAIFLGTIVLSLGSIIFFVATGFDPTGQNKP